MLKDIKRKTEAGAQLLKAYAERRVLMSPYGFIDEKRQRLDIYDDKLNALNENKLSRCRAVYERLLGKLEALSPLSVLTRGYGAVYSQSGEVLTSVSSVDEGDTLKVRLKDGEILARAEAVTVKEN